MLWDYISNRITTLKQVSIDSVTLPSSSCQRVKTSRQFEDLLKRLSNDSFKCIPEVSPYSVDSGIGHMEIEEGDASLASGGTNGSKLHACERNCCCVY